jgi:hypothetical protein
VAHDDLARITLVGRAAWAQVGRGCVGRLSVGGGLFCIRFSTSYVPGSGRGRETRGPTERVDVRPTGAPVVCGLG